MSTIIAIGIFVPLAAGLLTVALPGRMARWLLLLSSVLVLAFVVVMLARFPSHGGGGLHWATKRNWISELGIKYSVGINGLNLWLIVLTAVLWVPATLAACFREWDRPRLFFFNLGLAETAVLGAFCAQDLALFVVFFDLMLVPFYFLIGGWGERDRVRATTKFVIYTLVGSLLMLAGAVALGVLSTPAGGHISFEFTDLAANPVSPGTQYWIFFLRSS